MNNGVSLLSEALGKLPYLDLNRVIEKTLFENLYIRAPRVEEFYLYLSNHSWEEET